jgi:beta-lactamase class C
MPLNFKKTISFMICLVSTSIFSNAKASSNEDMITQRMTTFMQKYHIHGATVLIASHGKIKAYLFGEAVPTKHIPVSEDTIFELGSITKTFTGLILAENTMSNKVKFAEPIQQDIEGSYSPAIGKITYLELATYTSGLPLNAEGLPYNASASLKNQAKLRHYLKKSTLAFQPGSKMLYSNLGFAILGEILAKKEQISLPNLMQRDILSPLNMDTSGLDISHENQKYLAQGYTADGKPVPSLPSGLFGGSWAMKASVKDMRLYLKAALGEPGTPKKIQQAMRLSQKSYYDMPSEDTQIGLGWLISPLNNTDAIQKLIHQPAHYQFIPYQVKKIPKPTFNPNALIGKIGATDGFRAYIAVIPEKHTGIVIMINRFINSSGALTNLANEILLQESNIPFKK